MSTESRPPDEQEALRAEIEETRAELGETVEALSAKADIKGQAKAKLNEVSGQAKSNPAPFAAAAGGVAALLLIVRRLRRMR
jgi:hypothetical protein